MTRWPLALYLELDDAECDELLRMRAGLATHHGLMATAQNEAGTSGDRVLARFFKEEAADSLKSYRGMCLVAGHLLAWPPGDCPFRRFDDWPLELLPYAERASGMIELILLRSERLPA